MERRVSRRSLLGAGLAAGVGTTLAACGAEDTPPTQTTGGYDRCVAIVGATVISVDGDGSRSVATVLTRGDRIVSVGDVSRKVPDDALVLDGRGKFLLPGLMDLHVHQSGNDKVDPALFLVNGVTTIREMSGSETALDWRQRTDARTLLGPRPVVGSPMVDGSPSLWTGLGAAAVEVADADSARETVRKVVADGADFVKVYTRLSEESLLAIADETRQLGVPFAGHCPDDVSPTVASDAGQRSFEHVFTLWYATSSHEGEIRRKLKRMSVPPGGYADWFQKIHPLEVTAARSYDEARGAQVFKKLARNRTHAVPTLAMHRVFDLPDKITEGGSTMKYVPADVREAWKQQVEGIYLVGRTPKQVAEHKELMNHRMRYVTAMHRHGVPLMAGTDTGTPYCSPGFALHDELELLVRTGMTPVQALRAATLTPARFLGVRGVTGTVSQGSIADLLLVDADPLADIRNTRRVHAVVANGRLIAAAERERMLADVAAACVARPA
jgi:imidazolonepropionase-like amidohydrolase